MILEHIQLWTTAQTPKTSGRGNRADNQQLLGIQKLRELILELAVRGKLVPQDPTEEPASTLLQQIKFVTNSNPISDDELPFNLPNGWSWCRLGDIGYTNIGLTYSPKDISDDGIPVLRSSNIQNGEICLDDLVRVNTTVNEKVLVEKGDLLICARNGSRNLVGKCALIKDLTEKTAFGAFIAIFRSDFNGYIKFFIESPIYRRSLEGVTTTTINQITQGNLKATVIALPPLTEQHRIVAKVDELMALCDQLEQQQTENNQLHQTLVETLLANLTQAGSPAEQEEAWQRISAHFDTLFTTEYSIDQLKQTILQLAVMGKLVPQNPEDEPASELLKKIAKEKARLVKEGKIKKQAPLPEITDDEKPFELPEGWEWALPDDFSLKITDGEHFRPPTQESGIYFLSAKDIRSDGVSLDDPLYISEKTASIALQRCNPEKGDILIVSRGATVGRMCTVDIEDIFCLLGSVILIKPTKLVDSEYLKIVMKTPHSFSKLVSASGSTAQPAIYLRDLKKIAFPIAPLSEQHRIVSKVDELFALCDALKERLAQAQTIQNLLAGAVAEQVLLAKNYRCELVE